MNLFILFLSVILLKESVSEEIVAHFPTRHGLRHRNREKRQVLLFPNKEQELFKWPNNTVHYYFDEYEFDMSVKEPVLLAMEMISNHTCIKFTTEPSDLVIKMISDDSKNYCYAAIGHQGRGDTTQVFSFNAACYSAGMAAHELIHSLGFIHAHQRSDRDQYLKFRKDLDSLDEEYRMQYDIYKDQEILVPYDYGSIMQYIDTADEYAPVHKNRFMRKAMGSLIIAYYDYLMINKYYECSCGENNGLKCLNDGYPNPANCSQCNCPLGFGGDDCSQRPEPGATLEAKEEWQNTTIALDAGYREEIAGKRSQFDYIYHYLWITAPANKTTEIRVNSFKEEKCSSNCQFGGVEIKTNPDPKLTSPRLCCDDTTTQRSLHTPTIVMAFNSEGLDEYTISYRYK
ncbi:hypothetical protein CAEBREN_18554 [Caenorhabditis brenneri]|uniref:Zinc metalloproteinase n=1 Tax=Caenorhabditis brenneri TaxID=135651 RepID=G0P9N1_CAEBE|nr:hypothetical protein CAEBREN_18554 [Caenorhabditis brenneri]